MRLWSLHPKYLDSRGLVALWRESLLAQAVLRDETIGYRNHPQLERFRNHPAPRAAISRYLRAVHVESVQRGYSFDPSRIRRASAPATLTVTTGQMAHEWAHLMRKLQARSPAHYRKWRATREPEAHPLFRVLPGPTESWER
ncbi:MAG: pyrimidine dimer DNA glycosylase/endonuclease V [Burkholderiaceae bacterium]|nr:pyrimidine dimer DNA glycosylase/endonuclease V [Burkholderiaceae bacterium]